MPTTRNLLLTGAGFTHNFGAPLARGLWNRVFNARAVRAYPALVEILDRMKPDFETAYYEVLEGDFPTEVQAALRSAVEAVFSKIDEDLLFPSQRSDIPSIQGVTSLIREFRPRSSDERGYFFTLNQDVFVERHIMENAELHPLGIGGRRGGGFSGQYLGQRSLTAEELRVLPDESSLTAVRKNPHQHSRFAYVKLHGSQDWRDSSGRGAMVLGRAKEHRIAAEPLLRWYFDLFRGVLTDSPHRLVVIGYSFRDEHINEVIAEAVNRPGLDLIVISPTPKEDFEKNLAPLERGSEICGALLRRESGYYEWLLRDVFPSGPLASPSAEWDDLRSRLRS